MASRRTPEELLAAERAKIVREAARAKRDHVARLERAERLEERAEQARIREAQRAARDADRAARRQQRTQKEERTKDTRRKILVGAVVLSLSRENEAIKEWLDNSLNSRVVDPADRELLRLAPLELEEKGQESLESPEEWFGEGI
jgi:large subunit ribosomal protein L7/L12